METFEANVWVGDISQSPTLTVAGTQTGVILGTAPYMSPEQVRGLTGYLPALPASRVDPMKALRFE